MKIEAPRTILVINVTRIGDTLLATPVLRALAVAWPQARIDVLAHPKRVEVLQHLPFLARTGAIEKQRARLMGWWPQRRYDLALVYGHDTSLLKYALRVAARVVAFRQGRPEIDSRLFRAVDEPPPHTEHAVDRALRLTGALGIPAAGKRLALCLTTDELAWAAQQLAGTGLDGAWPLIGLQVASFPTKAYRDWPVTHFAELCERIVATWPQAGFLIFGGPEEMQRTAWLKEKLGTRAALLAGKLSLRQTAAMMARTHAYVGVDTGPTHIMSTFDIPVIGLYHCRLPRSIYGPLDHPLDFSLDHPRVGLDCDETSAMADIAVADVFARLYAALAATASQKEIPCR